MVLAAVLMQLDRAHALRMVRSIIPWSPNSKLKQGKTLISVKDDLCFRKKINQGVFGSLIKRKCHPGNYDLQCESSTMHGCHQLWLLGDVVALKAAF